MWMVLSMIKFSGDYNELYSQMKDYIHDLLIGHVEFVADKLLEQSGINEEPVIKQLKKAGVTSTQIAYVALSLDDSEESKVFTDVLANVLGIKEE